MAHSNHAPSQMTTSSPSSGRGQSGVAPDKVFHTVTAGKQDVTPAYHDATPASETVPNSNIRRLQAELIALEKEEKHVPDAEAMIRGAGMIKFNENDEYRFLGPSSGIGITRLVMELAKHNTVKKSIREIVPDSTAREIKQKFDSESGKPTSKVYPLISSVAAPNLPTHDLMDQLVDIYMAKAQYMLPLLHEPTFKHAIQAVYHGSADATLNFQLRLVIAISMQKLDTQYAGLADSYYLSALPYLESAVRKKDLSTLQCLALIAQYSVLTPTRTASYWVVGLATRLCQELGLCEERTIKDGPQGIHFNTLEVDMRRRLFWIITSMEYGLAHTLGRPSAFGTTVDHINVGFFELCDDRFITPEGLLPGHQPVMKKCISIHFFKMRLLQAEIRRTLYLKKRDRPVNDQDQWFNSMQRKIDEWVANCPKNDEGSGVSERWFHSRRNTMIVFLYRPSPQVPEPSEQAAEMCFDASVENIHMQSTQIATKSVDLTWIFTQMLFMGLNTILWSLSYHAIRRLHPMEEVKVHIDTALDAIKHTSERWPGVQSALQLYQNLIEGCLTAYSSDASYVVRSPPSTQDEGTLSSRAPSHSPASPQPPSLATSHLSLARCESHDGSYVNIQNTRSTPSDGTDSFEDLGNGATLSDLSSRKHSQQYTTPDSKLCTFEQSSTLPPANDEHIQQCGVPLAQNYGMSNFNPNSVNNAFPATIPGLSHWDSNMTTVSSESGFAGYNDVAMDTKPWLGSFGDEYSRYMHQAYNPPQQRMQSLSEQQQLELMAALERDQLPDVSNRMSDAAIFYTGNIL